MCGRYTLTTPTDLLASEFDLRDLGLLAPRYNIAPTQPVPVVTSRDPHALSLFRWGLIPSWSKERPTGTNHINARAETLLEKPSFRDAFRSRRCFVLADGFYEWRKDGTRRRPFYIRLRSRRPFAFAGLWEVWRPPEGPPVRSCAIVTTDPNDLVRPLHDRMPAILTREAREAWLSVAPGEVEGLRRLLAPYPAQEMEAYEVSPRVNAVENDSPECIAPSGQGSLF
jgi:putative SOS response-associated peptidase YedK